MLFEVAKAKAVKLFIKFLIYFNNFIDRFCLT